MEIVNINEKDDADNSYYIFINVISCIFGLICFYALTSAIAQGYWLLIIYYKKL